MEKFVKGDKVVRVGTKFPVMTIKGKTKKGNFPNYSTLMYTWTCYWENSEPHWEVIKESELEHYSS